MNNEDYDNICPSCGQWDSAFDKHGLLRRTREELEKEVDELYIKLQDYKKANKIKEKKERSYLIIDATTMKPFPLDSPGLYLNLSSAINDAIEISNNNEDVEIVVYELKEKIRLCNGNLEYESPVLPSELMDLT